MIDHGLVSLEGTSGMLLKSLPEGGVGSFAWANIEAAVRKNRQTMAKKLDHLHRVSFSKANEFWRFVFAHQEVGKYAQTFLEYPPMQEGASFNMYALRTQQVRE